MKKILIGLSIGLLASVSTAQIPMSDFVRTFTSSLTRGFYFQAPADFTATHVQVPDETNKGTYQFAIYKLSTAPPPFSQTLAVTPEDYQSGVKSTDRAKLTNPIAYKKGDWLAILGCAGPTSGSCSNSYGTSANNSFLCGMPITLNRCGMQSNIGTNKGVGPMWSENAGPIGRSRIWIERGADSVQYCNLSSKTVLSVTDSGSAAMANTAAVRVEAEATNKATVIGVGLTRVDVKVPGFGNLCVGGLLFTIGLGPSSTTGTNFPLGAVPNSKSIVGTKLTMQAGLAGTTLLLSNGLELIVGQ